MPGPSPGANHLNGAAMKSLSTIAALGAALVLSGASIGANAQTGRPSEAPSVQPAVGNSYASGPGSYARYLMLNGTPRDVAIAEARNIDHPALRGISRFRSLAIRRRAAKQSRKPVRSLEPGMRPDRPVPGIRVT
jgi:hypothetical protein